MHADLADNFLFKILISCKPNLTFPLSFISRLIYFHLVLSEKKPITVLKVVIYKLMNGLMYEVHTESGQFTLTI